MGAGLSRDEVIGQQYTVLGGPETDAAVVQELWAAVQDNRGSTVELVRVWKGSPLLIPGHPLPHPKGPCLIPNHARQGVENWG